MRRFYKTGKSGFTEYTPGVSSVYTRSKLSIIYYSDYEVFVSRKRDEKDRCILVAKFATYQRGHE